MTVIAWSNTGAYACSGILKRLLSLEEVNALKYIGVKDLGTNQAFLDCLTEIPRSKIAGV